MPRSPLLRRRVLLPLAGLLAVLAAGVWFLWLRPAGRLPQPGSEAYENYVEAFEVGTAALDSGSLNQLAIDKLTEAVQIIPQEPAGWANLGICHLRVDEPKKAAEELNRALALAPGNGDIEELLSYLAEREGQHDQAVRRCRAALKADPGDVRRLYRLYELLGQEGKDQADAERQRLLEQILARRPTSLYTLAELAVLAERRKEVATLRDMLGRLAKLSGGWKEQTREALRDAEAEAGKDPLTDNCLFRVQRLQNNLRGEAGFTRDAEAINPRGGAVGTTFQTFLRLAPVRSTPAPPDLGLTFVGGKLNVPADLDAGKAADDRRLFPLWLDAHDNPVVLLAGPKEVRRIDEPGLVLPFPAGEKMVPPGIHGVLGIDWNNDERIDLVFAGAGGLAFYQQGKGRRFEDVTAGTKLPEKVLKGDTFGAWAADVDLDGDLDVLVAPRRGGVLLLRNNFDGTFTPLPVFPGAEDVRGFAWVDLDNDGAPDAVLLDAKGALHVFMNERGGAFRRRSAPEGAGPFVAIAVADVNDDGVLDVVAVGADGAVAGISDKEKGKGWQVTRLAGLDRKMPLVVGEVRLVAVDLDNNGAVDLVLRTDAGGQAWLADGTGKFQPLAAEVPAGTADVVSLGGDGRVDLLGWEKGRVPVRKTARPALEYHWLGLRPRGSRMGTGDNRVNAENIGGEAEVRAGTLVVKQPVERPVVHFGLGGRKSPSVVRIVWANGSPQFEFEKPGNAVILVEQRLKGSCPFLFTHDGKGMRFVADFCWSTPLGMYINGQARGGFAQTTDWVKVRGDQLAPRDGEYDVRVNANLWETHFLDHLSLVVVDHPPGTEVHVDERFFLTPTPPRLVLTGPSRPVARAWDHHGRDVTDIVREADGRYLDRAGRGTYQGVTADHWVEVDVGDTPVGVPIYLLARGWIHPTDSSLNVAMGQGRHPRPMPLTLETPDGQGGWKAAGPPLGFPAGKNKTCVIRLDGVAGKGVPRRFRLRTNLEIYWDALHVARGLDASACVRQPLRPTRAELRYRGLVRMRQAGPAAPELPEYDEVVCGTQHWRDLIGFHTRFGDVRELLAKIDDRYVIMNAGDEIRLRFPAPPPHPQPGWGRDFVWVCDGWVKDGDLNTRHGKTVGPLPYHGMKDYDAPAGALEDDPVYRRFPRDWEVYHTRYVGPGVFERGLRPPTRPRR
jgi:Tfp pilus assembly protein PilF